jgi:hypothetical protein
MSPVKYELGFYIPEDDILHSPRRENLKSYNPVCGYPFCLWVVLLARASFTCRESDEERDHPITLFTAIQWAERGVSCNDRASGMSVEHGILYVSGNYMYHVTPVHVSSIV